LLQSQAVLDSWESSVDAVKISYEFQAARVVLDARRGTEENIWAEPGGS